jgi:flagella basal body P-ring formation protein FlgA
MITSCVRTSTLTKTKQMLCLAGVLAGLLPATWAAAPAPQVMPFGDDKGVQVKDASPIEKMHAQVRNWMAQANGGSPDQVQIAPIDSRVQVLPCERPLWIDHPFASKETVRVRCPSVAGTVAQNANAVPVWQLYLRIVSALPVVAPAKAPAPVPVQVPVPARPGAVASANPGKMVVAKQLLQRGTVLTADMVQEVDAKLLPSGQVDTTHLTSVKDVSMAELVRDVPAGSPLRAHDIRRAVLVKMGQQVLMTVGNGNDFQIRVRVEALQDGRMGDQVKLKNAESGKFLSGLVTGPNAVKGL